jgi:hypothetical protein
MCIYASPVARILFGYHKISENAPVMHVAGEEDRMKK